MYRQMYLVPKQAYVNSSQGAAFGESAGHVNNTQVNGGSVEIYNSCSSKAAVGSSSSGHDRAAGRSDNATNHAGCAPRGSLCELNLSNETLSSGEKPPGGALRLSDTLGDGGESNTQTPNQPTQAGEAGLSSQLRPQSHAGEGPNQAEQSDSSLRGKARGSSSRHLPSELGDLGGQVFTSLRFAPNTLPPPPMHAPSQSIPSDKLESSAAGEGSEPAAAKSSDFSAMREMVRDLLSEERESMTVVIRELQKDLAQYQQNSEKTIQQLHSAVSRPQQDPGSSVADVLDRVKGVLQTSLGPILKSLESQKLLSEQQLAMSNSQASSLLQTADSVQKQIEAELQKFLEMERAIWARQMSDLGGYINSLTSSQTQRIQNGMERLYQGWRLQLQADLRQMIEHDSSEWKQRMIAIRPGPDPETARQIKEFQHGLLNDLMKMNEVYLRREQRNHEARYEQIQDMFRQYMEARQAPDAIEGVSLPQIEVGRLRLPLPAPQPQPPPNQLQLQSDPRPIALQYEGKPSAAVASPPEPPAPEPIPSTSAAPVPPPPNRLPTSGARSGTDPPRSRSRVRSGSRLVTPLPELRFQTRSRSRSVRRRSSRIRTANREKADAERFRVHFPEGPEETGVKDIESKNKQLARMLDLKPRREQIELSTRGAAADEYSQDRRMVRAQNAKKSQSKRRQDNLDKNRDI